jgi:uncharacterized membrane protein
MTSIPAEFYALANAFLFALHNMFTKKALRYSNPATAVISSLLINIIFLWGVSILFVPLSSLTSASILIFVVVGFFQPGLTRLLSYKASTLSAWRSPIRFAPLRRCSALPWRYYFLVRKSRCRSSSRLL